MKRTRFADEFPTKAPRNPAWIYVLIVAGAISIGLFFVRRHAALNKQSGSAEVSAKSIAVLPFESLSDDKTNAYFATGIQDEIITRLTKIADLKVRASRATSRKLRSSSVSATCWKAVCKRSASKCG
jgi:TolB-like protein